MTSPLHTLRNSVSIFHEGEKIIQEKAGVRQRVEDMGRRVVRDHMPDQHRDFFQNLPFVFAGTLDALGWPQASILIGNGPIICSPDPKIFTLSGEYRAWPRLGVLEEGSELGLLGIEFHTRRRNRVNGVLTSKTDQEMRFQVKQSFGACPKYIQKRDFTPQVSGAAIEDLRPHVSQSLGGRARHMVENADSFFIASQFNGDDNKAAHGVDVSNRGGKPGFVRLEDDHTLIWPDYVGNFMFNTLGNLQVNPKAGLLFIDFETGDVLNLRGEGEVVWDEDLISQFDGAQRFVRFHLKEARLIRGGLPARWTLTEVSPALQDTGSWQQVVPHVSDGFRDFRVERIVKESEVISSFYLKPVDGRRLGQYQPGQFLPVEVDVPGQDQPSRRTYTLSDAPGKPYYRLSIKRESGRGADIASGIVSCYFHDQVKVGDILRGGHPAGKFTVQDTGRPVVLISGGVGITPMIAMMNSMIEQKSSRKIYFIHGALNGRAQAFAQHLHQITTAHQTVISHIRYSHPTPKDIRLGNHDSVGFIDMALLKSLLPFDDYEFYLCGPGPFMDAMGAGLRALNITEDRIHSESFGPAAVSGNKNGHKETKSEKLVIDHKVKPVQVKFQKAQKTSVWRGEHHSLLEFAEAQGLSPDNSCRGGSCGSCMTKVLKGTVAYPTAPLMESDPGHALICCAVPDGEGEVVLDL